MTTTAGSPKRVCIVDYGMGNLWSVRSALNYLGCQSTVTDSPRELASASHIILPGVGSFRLAMKRLEERGLADEIRRFVGRRNGHILGICLGLQLLAASSPEDGFTEGFGFLPNKVEPFFVGGATNLATPHVGFNSVRFSATTGLFAGLGESSSFYFVHSFRLSLEKSESAIGITEYGEPFVAAIDSGYIAGTQFHPEKSQTTGLLILRNFLRKR